DRAGVPSRGTGAALARRRDARRRRRPLPRRGGPRARRPLAAAAPRPVAADRGGARMTRDPDTQDAPAYQPRDPSARSPALIGGGLAVAVVGASFAMHVLLHRMDAREAARSGPASPLAAAVGHAEPPAPRLQEHPREDLVALHAREQQLLDGYAWVDR